MGKAKRQRKKETADLKAWFNEFSVACPWRHKEKEHLFFCVPTITKDSQAMICQVMNCAPLFLANRLLQMTLGPRIYENDKTNTPGDNPDQEK